MLFIFVGGCVQREGSVTGGQVGVPAGTIVPAIDGTAVARSATATTIAIRVATEGLPPKGQCGRLNAFYQQLIAAPDPLDHARRAGLRIRDGRVEATIEIERDSVSQEAELARRYDLRIERRFRTVIDGFVPVALLCDLGQDPLVHSVGYPSRPKVSP
jgi:hypothetical protein